MSLLTPHSSEQIEQYRAFLQGRIQVHNQKISDDTKRKLQEAIDIRDLAIDQAGKEYTDPEDKEFLDISTLQANQAFILRIKAIKDFEKIFSYPTTS